MSNRRSDGSLTYARRACKADNLTCDTALDSLDGEDFKDSFLDLFHAVMLFIENVTSLFDVCIFLCVLAPWNVDNSIEIISDNAAFRRVGIHFCKAGSFLKKLVFVFFIKTESLNLLLVFHAFGNCVFAFAKLVIDGLYLFLEIIFALMLVDAVLDLILNTVFKLDDICFFCDDFDELVCALCDVKLLEHRLLAFDRKVDILADIVTEAACVLGIEDGRPGRLSGGEIQ